MSRHAKNIKIFTFHARNAKKNILAFFGSKYLNI